MSKPVDFDDFTENYNKLLNEQTSFFSASEAYFARYKVDLVRKQVDHPVGRLLEYGCGIGRNIPFLRQAFPEATVVGSDISRASLEIARRENEGAEFLHEEAIPNSIAMFDLIFVAGVFHHVPMAQRLLVAKRLFERLVPDGLIFIFEHNPFNPVTRHIVNNCPYDKDAELVKPSEMSKVLHGAGFFVQRKAYCLFVPPRLSALARLEAKLGWLPLGGQYWMQARRLR